jgi:hypothetical protein
MDKDGNLSRRRFKVINEHNKYYGREGFLIRENDYDLMLSIENNEYESRLIFDSSEVEEIV